MLDVGQQHAAKVQAHAIVKRMTEQWPRFRKNFSKASAKFNVTCLAVLCAVMDLTPALHAVWKSKMLDPLGSSQQERRESLAYVNTVLNAMFSSSGLAQEHVAAVVAMDGEAGSASRLQPLSTFQE